MNQIHLKKLDLNDLPLFNQWINDPIASGHYDGTSEFSASEMKDLFDSGKLEMIRIAYFENLPIGWGEITGEGEEFKLTVQISRPEYRGRKLGEIIHRLLIDDFKKINKTALYIVAWTHHENTAEQKILEKIGFVHYPEENKMFDINGTPQVFYLYEYELN